MDKIAACPSCRTKYRVLEEFAEQKIACKKCGTAFSLSLTAKDDPTEEKKVAPPIQTATEKSPQDDCYPRIGKLAVKYKFASETQINQALTYKQQKQAGQDLLLGEILVSQEILSQSQLDFLNSLEKLLDTIASDNQFAKIAVQKDFITQEKIDAALLEQKKRFKLSQTVVSIGDILVESGLLSGEQHDAVLSYQKHLEKDTNAENKSANKLEIVQKNDLDATFELSVSQDMLSAFILPKENTTESLSVENVKNFLKNKGIQYGLADDHQITAYLENTNNHKEPWKIAEGVSPEPGQETRITYYFDPDPLKTESIKDNGTIDFKDTGNLSPVKKGELIAEKIPAIPGSPGMDVYGQPVPSANLDKIKLRAGKGTTLSADGYQVFAEIDGVPRVSVLGRVTVLPRHDIFGDVGLETGHVDFEGDVHVTGSIQNGYRLKAHSLVADEILKAEIEVAGDIVSLGGIIEANVNAGGNIRATFVRKALIKAFGDVIVKKGIRDSQIETSGACIIKDGTILSSTIVAKKGIWASQIGSDVSKPCTLSVGVDVRANHEIDDLVTLISNKKQNLEKSKSLKQKLDQKSKATENKIGKLAQVQDRTMVEQRKIQSELKELQKAGDKTELTRAATELKNVHSEIKAMENDMEKLFELQDRIAEKIEASDQNIQRFEIEISEFEERISEIAEWVSNGNGNPEIRINENIFQDTIIDGTNSSLVLKRTYKNVLIKEYNSQSADDTQKYEMKISQQ